MTTAHLLYIPLMIVIGIFIGYHFGVKAAEEEQRKKERIKRIREKTSS